MVVLVILFLCFTFSDPKGPPCGPANPAFFGHEELKPWIYSQLLNAKEKKMNKDGEKEFQDDKYTPLYTYTVPANVSRRFFQPFGIFLLVSRLYLVVTLGSTFEY